MRLFITLLGLTLWFSTDLMGQSTSDSTRTRERRRNHGFTDANGDGVNDQMLHQQKRLKQGIDSFIDTNGDGISDGRERGLGIRRGTIEKGFGMGKQSVKKGQKGK
jgi:hypothetical protein